MGRGKGQKIPGLERKLKREGGYFDDLPYDQRRRAEYYLRKWIERRNRRGKRVERWLRPILVGQARRLAKNPPTSDWGRSMAAKKGGYAVQQLYRMEGRDPTAKESYVRQVRQGKPAKPRPLYPGRLLPTPRYQPPRPADPPLVPPDAATLRQGWGSPASARAAQERQRFKEQAGYFEGFEGEDGT